MFVHHRHSLKALNTFGLSSIAERYVTISDRYELSGYFEDGEPLPTLILGGGSNLLLTRDVPGTVLHIQLPGVEVVQEDDEFVWVKAGAGIVWHEFVLFCIDRGWGGVENLSLIPGCVGAAPMQNIGAYGVEIKEVFHGLEAYMCLDKSWQSFSLDECAFGYRESIFKRALRNRCVIASVTFRLTKKPVFHTAYGAIREELDKMGVQELSVKAISDAVIRIRRSKLPDPKVLGNSGSFFKNPVVSVQQFESLKNTYPDIVGYPSGSEVKLAAGWLIEKAGFKGKRFGNCGVHDRQALVLVNHGGATGAEVLNLSESIIAAIRSQFGVELEREVNVI